MQNRIRRFMPAAVVLLLSVLPMGCGSNEDYSEACELYEAGNHREAEQYFVKALEAEEITADMYVGHAYNLLQLKNYAGAESEFLRALEYAEGNSEAFGGDADAQFNIKRGLAAAYIEQEKNAEAAELYVELAELETSQAGRLEYKARAALLNWKLMSEGSRVMTPEQRAADCRKLIGLLDEVIAHDAGNSTLYSMRAKLYYDLGDYDSWESDLLQVTKLKEYAFEEYMQIYASLAERRETERMLELADEMLGYIRAHSMYVEDYTDIIAIMFDAADRAAYFENSFGTDYFLDAAEGLVTTAVGMDDSDGKLRKYEIIIAERRGKLELAQKLLGVYLNHFPDDKAAVKEKKYLENRIGVK